MVSHFFLKKQFLGLDFFNSIWYTLIRFKKWPRLGYSPLLDALKTEVMNRKCYVYELKVGGQKYIGFTSQKPETRLNAHKKNADKGSQQDVHKQLRRFGNQCSIKELSEHPNEIVALVEEISAIGIRPKA